MTDDELSAKLLKFTREIRAMVCEQAAQLCESMVITGRAWTENQAVAADALFAAARNIRKLGESEAPDTGAGGR